MKRVEGAEPLEPPPAFEPDLSAFLVSIQLEKGLADNTVSSYEQDLAQCSFFLSERGVGDWRSTAGEDVSAWLSPLFQHGLNTLTCRKSVHQLDGSITFVLEGFDSLVRPLFHRDWRSAPEGRCDGEMPTVNQGAVKRKVMPLETESPGVIG